MILAVDAGNTRVKWGLHADAWMEQGACPSAAPEALALQWRALAPSEVIVSNVAGATVQQAIHAAAASIGREPRFIVSAARQCGVRSSYRDPAALGCDRWAALIGAWALHPGPCVVVNAGTAMTVDALSAEGLFLGGFIVPGFDLMRRALDAHTAGLALQPGEVRYFPDNTGDAIASGAAHALAGAVERMAAFMSEAGGGPDRVLLSGGWADMLQPMLALETLRVDNLVLEGLVAIAREASSCAG